MVVTSIVLGKRHAKPMSNLNATRIVAGKARLACFVNINDDDDSTARRINTTVERCRFSDDDDDDSVVVFNSSSSSCCCGRCSSILRHGC